VCAIAVIALCATGCAREVEHAAAPVPVRAQTVEVAGGGSGHRYSATIRPDVQVDLAFKVSGYIESIHEVNGADGRRRNVQEGDFVRKGTALARVRSNEYKDRVEEARAALTKAKGDFDRSAQMYENHTISKAEYDAAYAQFTASQARFNQADVTLNDCVLPATMDGWVMRRSVEVGSLVSPGAPAFVIADMRAAKAVIGVPDVAVGSLVMGATHVIRCEALPGELLRGTITRIAPSADPSSHMFEVECTIPNPENKLRSGMIATIELAAGSATAAPASATTGSALVPLNAVVRPSGDPTGYAVFVVEEAAGRTIARSRQVELGDVQGNLIRVTSGLSPGDRVIVVGASLVVDAQEVTLIP
jgi:multidrug efflux system membrane fusion protein